MRYNINLFNFRSVGLKFYLILTNRSYIFFLSFSVPVGQTVFTNFLKSEFSDENIEFWLACEDYKTTAASKLVTRARQIYQQYVDSDAPREVKKQTQNLNLRF